MFWKVNFPSSGFLGNDNFMEFFIEIEYSVPNKVEGDPSGTVNSRTSKTLLVAGSITVPSKPTPITTVTMELPSTLTYDNGPLCARFDKIGCD